MKLLDYNSFINQDRQKVQSVIEHLWSGIIHRSETGEERNEDQLMPDVVDYLNKHYI